MNEAQGVEFDIVFVVGIDENTFSVSFDKDMPPELTEEKKRINRDLLYVALTRAISELHVLGRKIIKRNMIDQFGWYKKNMTNRNTGKL